MVGLRIHGVRGLTGVLCGLLVAGPALAQRPVESMKVAPATTASPPDVGLVIEARNLVLDHAPTGWSVTDFIQLRNDGTGLVLPSQRGVTFAYPLPSVSEDATVVSGDRVGSVRDGVLTVHHPMPPGEHLFVVRYRVPAADFDVPLPGVTEMVDVLLREPAPAMDIDGLKAIGQAQLDGGEAFVHFSGDGFRSTTLSITEVLGPSLPPAPMVALALGLLLAGSGFLVLRTGEDRPSSGAVKGSLIVAVAKLDTAIETHAGLGPEERRALEARRQELVRRIRVGPVRGTARSDARRT
jgi:hypothetical protein